MNNVSLKYTTQDGLEIRIGDKILDLSIVMTPLEIRMEDGGEPPQMILRLCIDSMDIESLEAFKEIVDIKEVQ